jgi:hypothetical protein
LPSLHTAGAGAAHAARKAPLLVAAKAPSAQSKRGQSKAVAKVAAASKSAASKSMSNLAAAAATGKATLPLDKAAATKGLAAVRSASASRLASQLQQH